MKLAEWGRANGVHPQTAYRWFREDRVSVPVRRLQSGPIGAGARVSSHNLDRQVARIMEWATGNGHTAGEMVTEVGSGQSGRRPRLRRIVPGPSAGVLMVEHRNRAMRAVAAAGREAEAGG